MIKSIKYILLITLSIILFTGCGAEGELEDMGIPYTQDGYFKHGVYKKNIPVLDLFYEAGMPVETSDKDGDTAIYKGYFALIKFLIEEHGAKIKDKSLTNFIRKSFRGEEKGENILKYLFSKGAKLTDNGASRLSNYYTNSKHMDTDFMLLIAKNGLSAKASTQRLIKIYENFDDYVRNKRRNSKTTFKEINQTAKKLTTLINQLIQNGADVKKAYSRFHIPTFNVGYDKNNWMKELIKVAVDSGKIDLNKDMTQFQKSPILIPVVYNFEKIEDIQVTVKYLLDNGADPLVRQKDGHRTNRNAIDLFCKKGSRMDKRSSSFYPEICQTKDAILFKLLFTDKAKYEKVKSKNSNFIKAKKEFKNKNYKQALSLFLPYAEKGNLETQEKLGYLYDGRKGVKENIVKAAHWYKEAAKQGSNKGEYLTGVNYEYGTGFKKNKSEAKKWYEKAYKSANSSKNKRMIKKRIKNL